MNETFKNVSIFLMFLAAILVWNAAKQHMYSFFSFDHGPTILLCLWSTCVVIIFHLLYYYFGRTQEKTIYLSTLGTLGVVGALLYYGHIPLS